MPPAPSEEPEPPFDALSAFDALSSEPVEEVVEAADSGEAGISDNLLGVLDAPSEPDMDEEEDELTVEDFKWNENVLQKLLDKNGITDRDAFLEHAIYYDADQNQYLKKSEIQDAIDAWLVENPPEVDAEPETEDAATTDSSEDSSEATADDSAVSDVQEPAPEPPAPPVVDLPPPPLPPPPVPVEEAPPEEEPELPPPAAPEPPSPPAPAPPVVVIEEEEEVEVEEAPMEHTDSYSELWRRRSGKSLPQVYGAIDRIASGEVGTLLDRYSDRFGHELDREIIVMRKAEQVARRDAVPTVELISTPSEEEEEEEEETFENELDSETEEELRADLSEVEDLLRPLQRFYKAASNKSEKKLVAPALKSLIAERKALLAVLGGDADEESLDDLPARPEIPELPSQDEEEEDEDRFADFFAMINSLLGEMPEDWVGAFVESKSFKLFEKVGADPGGADTKSRKRFFRMINEELGEMPEDMLDDFLNSADFQFFQQMGELYGE